MEKNTEKLKMDMKNKGSKQLIINISIANTKLLHVKLLKVSVTFPSV